MAVRTRAPRLAGLAQWITPAEVAAIHHATSRARTVADLHEWARHTGGAGAGAVLSSPPVLDLRLDAAADRPLTSTDREAVAVLAVRSAALAALRADTHDRAERSGLSIQHAVGAYGHPGSLARCPACGAAVDLTRRAVYCPDHHAAEHADALGLLHTATTRA